MSSPKLFNFITKFTALHVKRAAFPPEAKVSYLRINHISFKYHVFAPMGRFQLELFTFIYKTVENKGK